MIYYRPTDGDAHSTPLRYRPCTCFLMTQLGEPVPETVRQIRADLTGILQNHGFEVVDANSVVTGRDFLIKIWEIITTVLIGIAIVHDQMRPGTLANIFYELGLMQAYGKETLVIKTSNAVVPSDLIRTEYVVYGPAFETNLLRFLHSLQERASYYAQVAHLLENNPLLAIDYLRRSYLLTGEEELKETARRFYLEAGLDARARNSVETLLASF